MRASGVLMPVSSLPSRYGIGCFSKEAYEFVDCLERAGQSKWQVLPLGPTGYGDSPYQPFSTFAGNPYFIDLDMLVEEGLLFKEECEQLQWGWDPRFVDYERIYFSKNEILRKAYGRFDADDKLKDNTFRQVTKIIKEGYSEVVSYPLLINMLVKKRKINIYSYTMKKFKRMDAFLTKIDKIEV